MPWSTLCRADWVRDDLVCTMRGWLLRHYCPSKAAPGSEAGRHGSPVARPLCLWQCISLALSSRVDRLVRVRAQILPRTLIPFAIFVQRAQLGQETDQIVQPATQPVHRRRDDPAFVESSPLAVSV